MNISPINVLRGVYLGLGALLAIGFVVFFFVVESYFYPAPYISTEFTQGFSWEAYEAVRIGMTKDEVQKSLGTPFQEIPNEEYTLEDEYLPYFSKDHYTPEDRASIGTCWNYARQGSGITAWISVHVCFDNETGLVHAKNKRVNHD